MQEKDAPSCRPVHRAPSARPATPGTPAQRGASPQASPPGDATPPGHTATIAAVLVVAAITVVAALMTPGWRGWHPVLLLAPAVAGWAIRRTSLLATLYLAQITVYYGLTWLVVGSPGSPTMVALVMLWAAGVLLGAHAVRVPRGHPTPGDRPDPLGWPHFTVAAGLVALQATLALSAKLGVAAQLTGGLSTPTGVLGILITAAPAVTLMLLVTSLNSGRHTAATVVVVITEVVSLALSGFRGSAVLFVIAVFTIAALRLSRLSPWRRPGRVAVGSLALLAVAIVGFIGAANVKSEAATNSGLSSAGTELFGLDEALPTIANRLDLRPALQTAVDLRDDPSAADAVSWTFQLQALVPRALWPNKPIIDYGQRVTAEIYGARNSRSSSTVTTIGDTLINFGAAGVVVAAVLLGALLRVLERLARYGRGPVGLALAASVAVFVVGQEAPLILSIAGLIRNLLVSWLLWRLATYLGHTRTGDGHRTITAPDGTTVGDVSLTYNSGAGYNYAAP
jgi:hypothetical protein